MTLAHLIAYSRMRRHRRRRAGFLLEHRDREVLGLPIEYPTRFYATRTPNKRRNP